MNSAANKEYSVNWKNHMSHVRQAFDNLLSSNELTDVVLYCEGKKISAHRMVLSACSAYFRDIFKHNPFQNPIIVIPGVEYEVMADIIRFIYQGEVSVDTERLDTFLKTAQLLQISGLTEKSNERVSTENEQTGESIDRPETETEDKFLTATTTEELKRAPKRTRTKEGESTREKAQKQEDETVFLPDVKCEPNELMGFEDPLEDPLLQNEQNEQLGISGTQSTEEQEFKLESAFLESPVLEVETKVRHSNFSEDCLKCLVCSKVFSHPYSLHHHKAVHSGNTQCPICHAILSRKYNLKMHMKARHNV